MNGEPDIVGYSIMSGFLCKFVVQLSSEKDIIDKIDSLSIEELSQYNNFYPQDLRHYINVQKKWLEDGIYYLGTRIGRRPTQDEIIKDMEQTKNAIRFRAFYCLSFPEKVKK